MCEWFLRFCDDGRAPRFESCEQTRGLVLGVKRPGSLATRQASCRTVVAAQQSAEAFGFEDHPGEGVVAAFGVDQFVPESLVRTLAMIMGAVIAKCTAERLFAEQEHAVEALGLHRQHRALSDSVHVVSLMAVDPAGERGEEELEWDIASDSP